MTNKEHYRNEIEDMVFSFHNWGVVDNKIVACEDPYFCSNCCCFPKRNLSSCGKARLEWMRQEYKENKIDWQKVPVDTKIYVKTLESEEWMPRYFAKVKDGKVFAFADGKTSFSGGKHVWEDIIEWRYAKLAEDK